MARTRLAEGPVPGEVVGDSTFGASESIRRAAIFRNGSAADLGTLTKSGKFSRANSINASGQVVGFSGPKLDDNASRAFIWSASTGMVDLGTLGGAYAQALAINDSGLVTGHSQTAKSRVGEAHAFIYQFQSKTGKATQGMRDLGTIGGNSSYGTFINAKNHVVGYSTINDSEDRIHAFLYDGTKMYDLGSLGAATLESDQSFALGVNNADQVVGYSFLAAEGAVYTPSGPIRAPRQVAFVYSKGRMMDLNELIGAAAQDYSLYSATAINDEGQIVASAFDHKNSVFRAVLLTPKEFGLIRKID
jgi:probable HAF family extracellular repeat protein